MKQIPTSEFGTQCLALINEVQATGEPVLVTEDGKPVVKLVPVETKDESIIGHMVGKAKIVGDIVSPTTPLEEWEALK